MSAEKLWGARSLEDAAGFAAEADPRHLCDTITGLTDAHEATFERSLDLVGSHALMSPRARAMLGTGLIDKMRQTGLPGNRVHAGAHWIDRIETIAVGLAKRLFGVAYAEIRPLSCALANGLVFAALATRGDTILAQTRHYGADPSTGPDAFGDLFGLEYADLPYDETQLTVDVERTVEAIRRIKPRLVVFGSGFILFPYPLEELKKAAQSVGATVFYDGAHAVGLTGGGQYQDPIAEGADVVTGSVPKTLCGPTGGVILTNDPEIGQAVQDTTGRIVSSYPNTHLAALAITLAEMLQFGKDYAKDVILNAQALARALDDQGMTVLGKNRGFTQSHLLLLNVESQEAVDVWKRLEAAGLFATPLRLPAGSPLTGIRLGTASVTRRGMGEGEMKDIASFIGRVVRDGEEPAVVAKEVAELATAFTKTHYCFD